MRRRIAIILLLLAGGAIVNVAVAWGCCLRADTRSDRGRFEILDRVAGTTHMYSSMGRLIITRTGRGINAHVPGYYQPLSEHEFQVAVPQGSAFSGRGPDAHVLGWYQECLAGLPALALRGHVVSSFDPNFGEVVGLLHLRQQHPMSAWHQFPTQPLWPGFIINTLFYALLLWLLFFTPFIARRMLRRRRGLCEKCAYPIGVSPVCTECGAAVPRKVEA